MYQHNLIKHLEEVWDAGLAGTVMYSQFSYFTPDNISIGPLEIRPLFFQERQARSHLGP
jgi:hypothetical protein